MAELSHERGRHHTAADFFEFRLALKDGGTQVWGFIFPRRVGRSTGETIQRESAARRGWGRLERFRGRGGLCDQFGGWFRGLG